MKRILKKIPVVAVLAAILPTMVLAQDVAVKTNMVNDLLLSPNLGVEIGLKPKWTLDLGVEGNFWTVDGHTWKHAFVQPEARYWFCQRFAGHFMGLHAIGGIYNFGHLGLNFDFLGSDFRNLNTQRFQGWGAGAGVAYGYAWPLHKHWNIEAVFGFGWIYTRYDSYPCQSCGKKLKYNQPHNYVGPTKVAVNVEAVF